MKLNKLEQQIFLAISEHPFHTNLDRAKIVAKIALELAEKAYERGKWVDGVDSSFDQFKQEIL